MTIPCRLHEAEEIVSEMDLFHVADDIMESEEDYRIVVSGWWVYIPSFNINLHEGVFCNYDEEEREYLPDFAVTAIMEVEQEKEGGWLYYEQDGFLLTVLNYFGGQMDMETVSMLPCLICIPEGETEHE